MPQEKILIVEDDKHISKLVKYNLEKAGFSCEITVTGEDALCVLENQQINLIILDIMLPKMDGLETCKQIKQDKKFTAIPIIMLTAKGEEIDRIVGFELGVDDYVVKPFSPRELVLRVRAVLNRGASKEILEEIINIDDLNINIPKCRVCIGKDEIKLTAMEFKLLVAIIQKKGRVLSRDQLLEDVWKLDSEVTTRTIDTHVKRLRQKLGGMDKLIETVRGYGYKLNEESMD